MGPTYLYWQLIVLGILVSTYDAVMLPGIEFNAAAGQVADASSYYNYTPNLLLDTVYTPQRAIDGFVDDSSWWSSGDIAEEKVFWQLNLTTTPPQLSRMIVRWHGFLTPLTYRIRISFTGITFQTIAVVANRSIQYDRVDNITQGFDSVDTRFRFLRIVIDSPNTCSSRWTCRDGVASTEATNERTIYGIREVELWGKGYKSQSSSCEFQAFAIMLTTLTSFLSI